MDSITKEIININDFAKVDIRAGTVKECLNVPGSEKLLKLIVDFGNLGERTILTGLAKYFSAEQFTGLKTLFVFNLEPRKMMGLESQGMLLAVNMGEDKTPELITLGAAVPNGFGLN